MTSQAILAAAGEAGFRLEPTTNLWTISLWHAGAHARFTAQRTAEGGWSFTLLYAGRIYAPTPINLADLIHLLTTTLGEDARRRAGAPAQEES